MGSGVEFGYFLKDLFRFLTSGALLRFHHQFQVLVSHCVSEI